MVEINIAINVSRLVKHVFNIHYVVHAIIIEKLILVYVIAQLMV